MDFFTGLALLMAAAYIAASFFQHRIGDPRRHRISLNVFLLFLVCYFGLPAIPGLGDQVAVVTRPIGVASLFLSLRILCTVPPASVALPADVATPATVQPPTNSATVKR